MNNTIGNEELAYVFEDVGFKTKKKRKNEKSPEYQEFVKMYNIDNIQMPENGQVISTEYIGKTEDYYIFGGKNYKDDIRGNWFNIEQPYDKNKLTIENSFFEWHDFVI